MNNIEFLAIFGSVDAPTSTWVAWRGRRQRGHRRDAGPLCKQSAKQARQNLAEFNSSNARQKDQQKLRSAHVGAGQNHGANKQFMAKCAFAVLPRVDITLLCVL